MYKSSSFTFFFKFIVPILFIIMMPLGIYASLNNDSLGENNFAKALIVATIWILIFLVQLPWRLKSIRTIDSGIIINGLTNEESVDFKDIEWVSRFDHSCPWFVTIKYLEKETGFYKKLSYVPKFKYQNSFFKDSMTDYIEEKIFSENPNWSVEEQPSQAKKLFFLVILALPFVALFFYFINGSN